MVLYKCNFLINFEKNVCDLKVFIFSFSVLVYLICAVLLIKPNSSRYRVLLQPASYLRSHPNLAPGFRKVISPLPDVYREPHYHRGEYYQQ